MLSQLTLSRAATRTANADGHSAQKPVASRAPETLQKRTLAALLRRPVDGSDRADRLCPLPALHGARRAEPARRGGGARSDDIIELARRRRGGHTDNRRSISQD